MAFLLTWLVQGLAIALIARIALRAIPGLSAATRYAMWWAALVLVLILPIVPGLTIGAMARVGTDASAPAATSSASAPAPASASAAAASQAVSAATEAPAATFATPTFQSFSLPAIPLPRVPDWLLSIVIGLWLGSAMIGLAQIAYSVHTVRQLKESCRRMLAPRESDLPMWSAVRAQGRAVSVRASNRVRTAAVLGLTRPIIAVPRDASAGLTPDEIDQIVLHEYAHVQRYDDWTKLLQVLIGAFFGWHPAVRLMMREIDFEREAACDDYVVDVTGAPRAYARCLTKVIEMMPGPGLAAIPYASSSPHNATTRIERLLDRRRPSGRFAAMPAMAGAVTLGALAFCTVHALPIATDLPHSSPLPGGASLASASVSGDTAEARDARATAVTPDANVIADANGSGTSESRRRLNLRIASASTLPIALPFSRFSPLSQLTDTRLPVSRVPTTPAVAPEAATRELAASPTPTPSSAVVAPGEPVPSATSVTSNAAGTPVGRHPHPSRPAEAPSAPAQHAVTELALGPVASAADPNSLPEASESGHIERAWENTRDATSKAMGVSARAVGTATKTAGDATKIATNKAAAGVKASGVKTARVFGHVKRTLASVF